MMDDEKDGLQKGKDDPISQALTLFDLTPPVSSDTLKERYQALLLTWHPHRNANLTNNPTKYMQMYKKGEAKTKEIHQAFKTLEEWLPYQTSPSDD